MSDGLLVFSKKKNIYIAVLSCTINTTVFSEKISKVLYQYSAILCIGVV